MAVIATFKAIPLSAFSNRPGGSNDPFVLSNDDPADFYNVSIDDDDNSIDGDIAVNETSDDANQIATVTDSLGNLVSSDACYIEWTATYTGSNGQVIEVWRIELDNGLRFFAMSEVPEVGVTFTTSNKDQSADGLDPADLPQLCFAKGTYIECLTGPRLIEDIRVGDLIITKDNRLESVGWVGHSKIDGRRLEKNEKLRPIKIQKGALGKGLPKRDLTVSRQHRMLVKSKIAMRMFDTSEVLVPAIKMVDLEGVSIDREVDEVEYFHLLFDNHEIIYAEGAPTESLYTGQDALQALTPDALEEIFTIFPELADRPEDRQSARLMPKRKQINRLMERHAKNSKPVLDSYDADCPARLAH